MQFEELQATEAWASTSATSQKAHPAWFRTTQSSWSRKETWTCAKGITTEGTQNKSNAVAIMRILDLLTT
ncbi:hypothetical protein ILT44_28390 [Microvirga sp. BT689]|uniref:hypothetical protein n=1 Tax=Microvirga arvi TaxID=2778731 RepID=UPI00195054E6|nr:hypothetical protein [Microvirga arvi]MBM6584120.1 hypothetical protein [Microvirga arvi]